MKPYSEKHPILQLVTDLIYYIRRERREGREENGSGKFLPLHLGDYPLTSPLPEEMLPVFLKVEI